MSSLPASVFSWRDLNRQPSKVLDAARRLGSVEIHTRTGEVFTFAPKSRAESQGAPNELPDFAAHRKRLREAGLIPPPSSEKERINRIIAGEE